jgi:hypothetical protein
MDYKYYEKTDIQWVSLETLKTCLEEEENQEENYPLRPIFKRTLQNNLNMIEEFCVKFGGSKFF